MMQAVNNKVRFVDKHHGAHFVHSIEIGSDFVTFFVISSFDDRTLQAMIDKDDGMIKHDAERFHSDDPSCAWIWEHFGYEEKTHFHMRLGHAPTREDMEAIFASLGEGVGPGLKRIVRAHFDGGGAHASA